MATMIREIRGNEGDATARDNSATIASVSDQHWHVTRTYGSFAFPRARKAKHARS